MQERGPNTRYEHVTRWSDELQKYVVTTRPINVIDHGPSRLGVEDDPGDEMTTPTANPLDSATISQLHGKKVSVWTQERWGRDRDGTESTHG